MRRWFEQPPAVRHRFKPDGTGERAKAPWSLMMWFDPAMTWKAAPTGKRGRQPEERLKNLPLSA